MNPFFFGTRSRRLFGFYEPASFKSSGKRAAVLCHPWGSEYVNAHRAMRQLAIRLSMAGFHTLRFDFFGTGDSAGESTDADLAGWTLDTGLAIEELNSIAGTTQVALIGMRIGAAVAMNAASSLPTAAHALVLWDPVVSGEAYLRQLGVARPATGSSQDVLEVQGFPLTPQMMRDIQSIDLKPLIRRPPSRALVLLTDRSTLHGSLEPWSGEAGEVATLIERVPDVQPWIEDTATGGVIPIKTIQRIIDWLA